MSQDTRFTENFPRKRLFVVISDSREYAQWIEHGEKHRNGYFQLVWVRLTIREKWWPKISHLDRTKRVLSFERVKACYRVSHIACYKESWESQKFFFWCFAISGGIGKSYANGLIWFCSRTTKKLLISSDDSAKGSADTSKTKSKGRLLVGTSEGEEEKAKKNEKRGREETYSTVRYYT